MYRVALVGSADNLKRVVAAFVASSRRPTLIRQLRQIHDHRHYNAAACRSGRHVNRARRPRVRRRTVRRRARTPGRQSGDADLEPAASRGVAA